MSKRLPIHVPADAPGQRPIWRSVTEKADPDRRAREAVEEPAIQIPEKSVLGRRSFFKVGGATAAAVGLAGCLRRPAENILPYSHAPEYIVPGVPLHFATSVSHHGEAVGLLIESHEGRPTKIEGNPEHPSSLGRTDAQLQGTILELYDSDRAPRPLEGRGDSRQAVTWADFDAWWREKAESLSGNGGRGLAVLAEPSDSPSFLRARDALRQRFPQATVHTWSAVPYTNAVEGAALAFGQPMAAVVDYAQARCVLALDCDFLGAEPGSIRNQRRWADARRLDRPQDDMGRLYAVESTLSLTGMNADHRLRLSPSSIDGYLRALAAQLAQTSGIELPAGVAARLRGAEQEGVPAEWIEKVAADLAEHRARPGSPGQALVCVGWRQPPHVHALAHAINVALGATGPLVQYFPASLPEETEGLAPLAQAMQQGHVDTLLILGGTPVYDAPADLGFGEALANVENSVHLSFLDDETSAACTWHLPRAHAYESWGDHRTVDGAISIQQPLIAPLVGSRSEQELLAFAAGIRGWRGYSLVRNTMRGLLRSAGQLEALWRQSLHRGLVVGAPRTQPGQASVQDAALAEQLAQGARSGQGWEAVFVPSYQTFDGRFSNVPWLLEMPDPVTKLVWDNAAYISPESAQELGVESGDLLRIAKEGGGELTIPAFVLPGHADRVVTRPLGWGRERTGRWGADSGFDVYPLRTSEALGFATNVTVTKAGGTYELVQTQDHHSMEGRPLAIDATLAEYRETPDFAQWRNPTPDIGPLWTQVDYSAPQPPAQGGTTYSLVPSDRQPRPGAPPRYKWGFVVDLTTCTGCSACVVACQAENNIPTVGKMEVARGREMHWMRIDRYFVGEDLTNPDVAVQPVACQHCEEAPCENVCPVAATTHSPEGLNDMAYNRCIGTRYCMNNCPYKVRRFNFLDFHGEVSQFKQMQFNPNVTVRMRGVMEKCTYCVQRIQAARIHARDETRVDAQGEIHERRIQPGELIPACAQACPSDAIVFGDLNDTTPPPDEDTRTAHQMAQMDRQYKLLASIGTQPRTTFLGKIRNPNPEMA